MNTVSASRAEGAAAAPARGILVWDAPVRVFHWLLVLCFAGAWLTSESERWQLVHVTLGYTVMGLVAFRLLWGLVGPRYARFSNFVRGPSAVGRYVGSLLQGQPEHHTGHNPAGALAILGLLALAGFVTATGWATYNELGGHALEELHEGLASTMLGLAIAHVGGVVVGSWAHRENLVAAMITGRKAGTPEEAIARPWRGIAALIFVAVLGFWWWQTL